MNGLPEGADYMTDLLAKWRALPLLWSEALRALVCLLPLLVATAIGQTTYLVTLATSSGSPSGSSWWSTRSPA
jgi:hypothetical protein